MNTIFSREGSMSILLHNLLEKFNFLEGPTSRLGEFFDKHPTLYKLALLVNHIFRAFSTAALCLFLPFSVLTSSLICLGCSVFYRLTVEKNCAYKFALPAFWGGMALLLVQDVAHGVLFDLSTVASFIPLAAYGVYVVLTVSYDVDQA